MRMIAPAPMAIRVVGSALVTASDTEEKSVERVEVRLEK